MRCIIYFFVIICLSISGCSGTPLTEAELEEREYQRAMDRENWAMCQRLYTAAGKPTWSDHYHQRDDRGHRPHEIKSDLWHNNCKRVLGEYYAE